MFFRLGKLSRLAWVGLGSAAGLALAGFWPSAPLHAVSTDRLETFAIATGLCDDSVEAIWFLDFLTGDLGAAVVSKQRGNFSAFFKRNINQDLGVDPTKNPRFLMSTGVADLRRSGGRGAGPSRSLCYVAEITTGRVAAYSIPWSSVAWIADRTMGGQVQLMDVTRFRTAAAPGAASKSREE